MKLSRLLYAVALPFALNLGAQTVQPIVQPHATYLNPAGTACVGCSLYSYVTGTTTAKATYTDSTGVTPNTNPVILGTDGGANIWLGSGSYKFVLKGTDGATIWTVDNVPGVTATGTYLPLAGGTLTGTLNGTSANFSGSISGAGISGTSFKIGSTPVIPATATGYHGTSGLKVQFSDGTGASGNFVKFASDGSMTNGPAPHGNGASAQLSDGTGTSGNLAKFDANGNIVDGGIATTSVPQSVANCGTTTTCANTAQTSPRVIWGGPVALTGGTATVTGISPAFTSTSSFTCIVMDTNTTPTAASCQITSTSSVTLKGTGTDTLTYVLVGN